MSDRQRCLEILSEDHVAILDLEGEIDIYTATQFKEMLLRAIDGGSRRFVVDLTKVTLMDSSGLSVLVSGERRLRPLGGSLTLAVTGRINRLLKQTGLDDAFVLCRSRAEALRAAHAQPDPAAAGPASDAL